MEFVEVNGTALRYEFRGEAELTLVMVHEMGGSLESWDDVIGQFPNPVSYCDAIDA